jgi:hypothetical protein
MPTFPIRKLPLRRWRWLLWLLDYFQVKTRGDLRLQSKSTPLQIALRNIHGWEFQLFAGTHLRQQFEMRSVSSLIPKSESTARASLSEG